MKKLFLLVALMFGLASCQNELEGLNVSVGEEQEVMLNVSLPESTRSASSTGFDFADFESNSKYDLRFILEISYNGKVVREVKTTETTSATFPVRLAPEKPYTFTVWADLVDEDSNADLFYNTADGLSNIKINLDKWTPNVEARDAYYLSMKKTFNAAADLSMELKRPFAKVRVVATDIKKVTDFDLNPTSAVATYSKQMFTSFNALTGEKAGLANVEHSFKYAEVDKYTDKAGERTVFADYIFVPEDGTVQFTLNVYADEAKNNLINDNAFNTPILVEQNKVTSIVGDVLTEGGNVKVTVDSDLDHKETYNYVDSANSLQQLINNAEDGVKTNIVLGDDVVIESVTTRAESNYGIVIPAAKNIVLNLNGHTISQSKEQSGKYAMFENNGTLTITNTSDTNGTLAYGDNATLTSDVNYTSNTIQNNGTLTINDGVTLINNSDTSVATYGYPHVIDTNGELTINGGIFTNAANYSTLRIWTSNTDADKCNVTINGGTFNGCIDFQAHNNNYAEIPHYGKLVVNGGTFNPDTYTNSAIRVLRFAVNANDMHAVIYNGNFNGKVWVRNIGTFAETPKIFDIYNGIFSDEAKAGTDANLLANGYTFVEGEDGNWSIVSLGYYKDNSGNYHITGVDGWLWMAKQSDTFFGSKTVYLDNDIDFRNVDVTVTRMFTPEMYATFDGQNHTVSNIWMATNYTAYNQALFDGLMHIKNLTVTDTHVYGMGAVGIIGANIFGNIENCHVKRSRSYGYVWQIGGIVGLHSWGEIKNCSVENTNIECYYYGAVGAIAGAMNEMSRKITNCSVKNCSLIKEGTDAAYADYDGLFGAFAGYLIPAGNYVFSGEVENTTIKVNGVTTEAVIYGEATEGSTVTYNGTAL